MTKLNGYEAIGAKKINSAIVLCKYADPTEDARENLSVEQALDVAKEDPSLIYAQVEVNWTVGDGSGHEGYNVSDYFRGDQYLGADDCGIEPIITPANLEVA